MSYTNSFFKNKLILTVFTVGIFFTLIYTAYATTFITYPGNPVLSGDGSGFDSVRIISPQVVLVDGVYHLLYGGTTGANHIEIGSAISSDGVNWSRVSVDAVLQCGEDTDSACATGGVWSNYRVVPEAVMYEDGIYKMWYLGNNQNLQAINRLGYATSTDGVNWNPYAQNPIFQPYTDKGGQFLGVAKVDENYLLYYRHFDDSLDINIAISPDGVNWTPYAQNPVIDNLSIDSVSQVDGRIFALADGVLGETSDGYEFIFETSQSIGIDHPQSALSSSGSELWLWRNGGPAGLFFDTASMPAPMFEDEASAVDSLILQYAPKLAMHGEEGYLPMDVGTFVEGSALWNRGGFGAGDDVQLKDASALSFSEFETIVGDDNTEDYYLAYGDPDTAASLDLEAAQSKYDSSPAEDTVYYRKMDDGEYTVLQYWYFYAVNNWKEEGGFNNHEGDWESVFVFLDKDTEEAKYVAYSAHHNDGFPEDNFGQYGSVRRGWDSNEIEKSGDQVTSYVALGSHANYPNNGNGGVHKTSTKPDRTATNGAELDGIDFLLGNEIQSSSPFWMGYEGSWGADVTDVLDMSSGPRGPKFSTVSGHKRFSNPVEWAGIDLIEVIAFIEGQLTALFERTGIAITLDTLVAVGKKITIEPYPEWISSGELAEGVTLLPGFWDITSDLVNGEFQAEVVFPYDPEVVASLGGDARRLAAYFYNSAGDIWEEQESVVDVLARTVSFRTDHFSRYALGFSDEEASLEDLFDQLVDEVEETDLRSYKKARLVRYVRLTERFALKDRHYAQRIALRLLKNLERRIVRYERRESITETESVEMLDTIEEIKTILQSE